MYEVGIDTGVTAALEGLPPLLERNLDDATAEPLDRFDFRLRRGLRRDDRARHSEFARAPGDALRHVAGGRGQLALRQSLAGRAGNRFRRAANFDRADGL